jgi:hypothetical protein
MKILKYILPIIVAGLVITSCEKNDPLAEQGQLTDNVAPFNLLAQMPDAKVEDTLMLRTVAWANDDDINNVSFFYEGFKVLDFNVEMELTLTTGVENFETTYKPDTVFIEKTLIRRYPEAGESLNQYYQTAENAYVIVCPFVVADGFYLLTEEGGELVQVMPDQFLEQIINMFSLMMKRKHVLHLFPGAPIACFEFDSQGFFTGNLTEFGFNYVQENFTRQMLVDNLVEATVNDNTRGTIESVASVAVTNTSKLSRRNFRIIN